MIVLDTNVLSEIIRSEPDARVRLWLTGQPRAETFSTAINRAEMLAGVAILPAGQRKASLRALIDALFDTQFGDALLAFDAACADRYGDVLAVRKQLGRPIGTLDAQIAAIALVHGAAVATRDVNDFAGLGLEIIDPWTA